MPGKKRTKKRDKSLPGGRNARQPAVGDGNLQVKIKGACPPGEDHDWIFRFTKIRETRVFWGKRGVGGPGSSELTTPSGTRKKENLLKRDATSGLTKGQNLETEKRPTRKEVGRRKAVEKRGRGRELS